MPLTSCPFACFKRSSGRFFEQCFELSGIIGGKRDRTNKRVLAEIKTQPESEEDVKDMLHGRLSQYFGEDLLAEGQFREPPQSFSDVSEKTKRAPIESHSHTSRDRRKHARATSTSTEHGQYMAYLKELDTYCLMDNTTVSVFLYFVTEEMQQDPYLLSWDRSSNLRKTSRKVAETAWGKASKHVVAERKTEEGKHRGTDLVRVCQPLKYGVGGFVGTAFKMSHAEHGAEEADRPQTRAKRRCRATKKKGSRQAQREK